MPDPIFRPGSDAEWQALLAQLRQQATAQPAPFFYARVRARLDASRSWLPRWAWRPVYAAVVAALVLAVSGDGATAAPAAAPAHRPAGR